MIANMFINNQNDVEDFFVVVEINNKFRYSWMKIVFINNFFYQWNEWRTLNESVFFYCIFKFNLIYFKRAFNVGVS